MQVPGFGTTGESGSSARMLAGTVLAVSAAVALVVVASIGAMFSITNQANTIEAERQYARVAAAFDLQGRARRAQAAIHAVTSGLRDTLAAGKNAADLQTDLQKDLQEFATEYFPYDGVYAVTAAGRVLAGIEGRHPAGQAGFDGLRHFMTDLPLATFAALVQVTDGRIEEMLQRHPSERGLLRIVREAGSTLAITAAPIGVLPGGDARNPADVVLFIGQTEITQATYDEMARRNGIAPMRLTNHEPNDQSRRWALSDSRGAIAVWLTWETDRPGDMMRNRFVVMLVVLALLSGVVFVYVFKRLRVAALQIEIRERQIQRIAGEDELSKLPNRRTFDKRLAQQLAQYDRTQSGLAVMLLDLDRFKAVNDIYGHTAGDELIRQVAVRLTRMVREGDTVARLGGDEFGIIQTGVESDHACSQLGQRILDELTKPFDLFGVHVTIGCSIGIALTPQNGRDRETLLKRADAALYQAKNDGRNRFSFFDRKMDHSLQIKRMVEDELRQAIENDELVLHYQPQVSVDGSRITGVEALVRWPHPRQGLIPPNDFIGIAEERGLIVPLGEWVLRRACLEAKAWEGLRLAVNVSPIQFRHKDFVANVIRIVAETGFDPARLELELTEGVVVDDADAAEQAMMELRGHGIGLALDDFGTGYSSLIYLRRFAFDKIKIDRSFLESMEATGESAILVHSVVHLGRALGLRVCAEGVETAEQQRFLQAVGCHELQGYLFSKPVRPGDITLLLAAETPFPGLLAA